MAVAKRQRKGKACENGGKKNLQTGVRTSGETNSIVKKVKIKPESHFSMQMDDAISLQPGIIRGNP